nr:hypothetical protein [Sulfurimonas sp. MAG313]
MQNMYFSKDKEGYLQNFLSSSFLPAPIHKEVKLIDPKAQDLEELLSFVWKTDELKTLQCKGIKIQVYLGSKDKIINSAKAKEFFLPYADTYMINGAGHTLNIGE